MDRSDLREPVYAEAVTVETELDVPELNGVPIGLVSAAWRLRQGAEAPSDEFRRVVVKRPGAVVVLALTDDDHVVFVRQFRAAVGDFVLELPAGLMDVAGEPPETTAARELAEETGYSAQSIHMLSAWNVSPGFTNEIVTVYLATGLALGDRETHGPEEAYSTVELVPAGRALDMAIDGRLNDMKSVAAILTAQAKSAL